ncbi:nucleoside permease [Providencia rettgeri]|uniref:nucleoside permease n=1 Tax=Providencia rettgeri TaxID=587 RepID=UPI0019D44788|nr:nucleoside permease [Providencia rettgeri]MBN7841629.1 nucleoside permease [Providencia rettgeri]MBN7855575.1 nucleoside permease [Providencia rettgeri]MBN7862806.1 nucleoside permease [Providencia rettgeri]MBN7872374.1 nucleoside permease [Providencia rettgeri]MBN7897433.1 nucleoside permease [Providencia rettgeri]
MKKTTAKLSFMMFIEWFIWGAWFVPLWLFLNKSGFTPSQIAWSYACTAIAAIISPILVGSITDRFFAAQKVLAVLMFAGAVFMFFAAQQTEFSSFFPLLLAYALTYMPTIALTNSIAFSNVEDVERDYPRIRVMGTIGWIASGIACGFLPSMMGFGDISATNIPLLVTASSSALLGFFTYFLPDTPPKGTGKMSIKVMLGLDAIVLLRDRNFLVFFVCSFLFAMPLAFYYIFANGYLTEVGMKNATGWMTLGQFSEIFFMLALPFFTKRFGIKKVLLLGLITAAIRYAFFIYGDADHLFTYGLLFLGILLHGVSYDFYYVTAYIYVDKKTPVHMRTAAQGLITLCCQGFGSLLGYSLGGQMMEKLFSYGEPVNGQTFNWAGMWGFGAAMIVVITIVFMLMFKESSRDIQEIDINKSGVKPTSN